MKVEGKKIIHSQVEKCPRFSKYEDMISKYPIYYEVPTTH